MGQDAFSRAIMAIIRVAVMAANSRDMGRPHIQIGGSWFVEVARRTMDSEKRSGVRGGVAPHDHTQGVDPELRFLKSPLRRS